MQLGGYSKQFEILDEGLHNGTLAAIQDLGLVPNIFDGTDKQKVRFVWLSDEKDSEGEPIIVLQSMTNSLHEKSTLRKTIKGVLGKDPGDDKIDDAELLGAQCQIVITHNESNGRTFANVTSVLPRKDGGKVEIPEGWEPPQVKKSKSASNAPF